MHCRIDWDGTDYVLTDSSTLGTLVNGMAADAAYRLRDGDVITIGDYQLAVSLISGGDARSGRELDGWDVGSPRAPIARGAAAPASATIIPGVAPPANPRVALVDTDAVSQLLAAAGLARAAVPLADAAVLAVSGALLRQFATGLAVTLAARARARKELGVAASAAEQGNPLLTDPPTPTLLADLLRAGSIGVQHANSAFRLAEAHQRATLHAMQGALARTLDAVSPAAIRARTRGNDAALWKAYEAAFAGLAEPGFIDLFATELGKAYEKLAAAGAGTASPNGGATN